RLAMVQIQPPRNPSKPFTSFGIKDILGPTHPTGYRETSKKEKKLVETDRHDNGSQLFGNSQPKHAKGVSPLDALMAMTSKTFEGLDTLGSSESKKRDQAALFGKHQPPKKRRKSRTAFTNQQIYELEKRFLYQKYLTPADRDEIAASLGLTNAQVITWFQNRRAKLKRDLEELKNDVTAAKKFPSHKSGHGAGGGMMSLAELELRRVQEKTLRDSFNNGGLQSPSSSSIASVTSEDGPEPACTPLRSPTDIASSTGFEELNMSTARKDARTRKLSDGDPDSINFIEAATTPTDLTRARADRDCVTVSSDKKSLEKLNNELANYKEHENSSLQSVREGQESLSET
ncbi:hypothetical protein EGW08_015914, partial [Elysia chlorotica]